MNFYDPATFEPFREVEWPWDGIEPLLDQMRQMQEAAMGVQVVFFMDNEGKTLEEAVARNLSFRPFYREIFGEEVKAISEKSARTYLEVLEGLPDPLRYEHSRVLHHFLYSFILLVRNVRKLKGLD